MGACTIAPNFCIVTEWCEGSTLYNLLHIKEIKMVTEDILQTLAEISRGIGYVQLSLFSPSLFSLWHRLNWH